MLDRIYSALTSMRNASFDKGILKTRSLPIPVISIGNITVGGTGKTPMVIKTAELAISLGARPCILTRGYGRSDVSQRVIVCDGEKIVSDPVAGGDEPYEMAKRLGGRAMVISDRNRLSAGEFAAETMGANLAILDDGFQHRRVHRDLDVVCIDSTDPFGNGRTLPLGKLREPLKGLARADLIILTRSDLVESSRIWEMTEAITTLVPDASILKSRNKIVGTPMLSDFLSGNDSNDELDSVRKEPCFVFCGVGNPAGFLTQMRIAGLDIAGHMFFKDHVVYRREDLTELQDTARAVGAKLLVTTAKDAVKLSADHLQIPCRVIETVQELDDETAFEKAVSSILSR